MGYCSVFGDSLERRFLVVRGVIETFPLDMLLSLGIGMAVCLSRPRDFESESKFEDLFFLAGLAFHLVFAFGIELLCYLIEPDWMLMYLTDGRLFPAPFAAFLFSLYFAMFTLGYFAGCEIERYGKKVLWVSFSCLIALIAVFIFLTFHRLWYVGSFDEYTLGLAKPITETSLFYILIVSIPVVIGGLILTLFFLRKRVLKNIATKPEGFKGKRLANSRDRLRLGFFLI